MVVDIATTARAAAGAGLETRVIDIKRLQRRTGRSNADGEEGDEEGELHDEGLE